jgi:uroporphyrinogen decarboxylase
MGLEGYCTAFYEQPELVQRIIADRVEFAAELYAPLRDSKILDFVQIWEDMAYKTASLVSPDFVRKYFLPAYEELVELFHDCGAQVMGVDCDGHVIDLVPIWMEAGIDAVYPCEIAAGSDPELIRQEYPRCALVGGMDKRLIARGREEIDAEAERIAPLVRKGGYIPMLDHFVPPDVSYDHFRYYVDRRREVLENAGERR